MARKRHSRKPQMRTRARPTKKPQASRKQKQKSRPKKSQSNHQKAKLGTTSTRSSTSTPTHPVASNTIFTTSNTPDASNSEAQFAASRRTAADTLDNGPTKKRYDRQSSNNVQTSALTEDQQMTAETALKNALRITNEAQLGLWDDYDLDINAAEVPSTDRGPTLQDPERTSPEPCPKAVKVRIDAALSWPPPPEEDQVMKSYYEEYMVKVARLGTARAACSWIGRLREACEANFELTLDAVNITTEAIPLDSLPESTPERLAKRSMAWDLYRAWRAAYIKLLRTAVVLRRAIRRHLRQHSYDESKTLTFRRTIDPHNFEFEDILEGIEVRFPAGHFSHIEVIDKTPNDTTLIKLTRVDGQTDKYTLSSLLRGLRGPSPEPTISMLKRSVSEPPTALRPLKLLRTLENNTPQDYELQLPQDLELIDLSQQTRFITRRDWLMALARSRGIEEPEEWSVEQMDRIEGAVESAVDALSKMDPSDLGISGHRLAIADEVYRHVQELNPRFIKDILERLREEGSEIPNWIWEYLLNGDK